MDAFVIYDDLKKLSNRESLLMLVDFQTIYQAIDTRILAILKNWNY